MEFDIPAQYDRDLRGAHRDVKRHKDSARKWRLGEAPSPGVRWNYITNEPLSGSESQQRKVRPILPRGPNPDKVHRNVVKLHHSGNQDLSAPRLKVESSIREELEASRSDPRGEDTGAGSPGVANDPFLYSFDRAVTPGGPLTLDVFVKAPTARDTERLVEKEYEVVDEHGQALKGREAKRNLRMSGSEPAERSVDDGFELV